MSNNVGKVTDIGNGMDLGPTKSIQMKFALLQMAMSELSKKSALVHMDSIQESQEKQKQVADFIQLSRKYQIDAGKDSNTEMPQKLKEYMDKFNLTYNVTSTTTYGVTFEDGTKKYYDEAPGWYKRGMMNTFGSWFGYKINEDVPVEEKVDVTVDKEQWETVIKSLQAHQEQLGTDTQQKMVLVQDFMGQYNSYLQGANAAINTNNQTLQAIAQGR